MNDDSPRICEACGLRHRPSITCKQHLDYVEAEDQMRDDDYRDYRLGQM